MERGTGSLGFWAVTIILIMVTAFCCAGTVMCRTNFSERELESCYRERERQLVEAASEYLGEQGYENSGVMLTRVVDADGGREYTLSVHHSRILHLSEAEREQLAEELREITFAGPDCVFTISMQDCPARKEFAEIDNENYCFSN